MLASATAWAQSDKPAAQDRQVSRGIAAYRELEYERAIDLLGRAVAAPTLSDTDKVTAYQYLGSAQVALDRTDDAKASFKALLGVDPKFTLSRRVSPRIRAVFDEVKQALSAPPPPPPPVLTPPPPPPEPALAVKKPLYKKAWFWGVIGGVVAVSVVAITVGVVVGTEHHSNAIGINVH